MVPSGTAAHQVAGAVEARSLGAAERIGDEALGGQLGPLQVAARQRRGRRRSSSPTRPTGTQLAVARSQHVQRCVSVIGRPIGIERRRPAGRAGCGAWR